MADLLILIAGLTTLLVGGWALVKGASDLATSLGISPMIVGLTVVAFGTSAPELAVNLLASSSGSGGMAFGNVIGSNLANIGLILGISALIRPLEIESQLVRRELPFMLLATAVAVVLGFAPDMSWAPGDYARGDGFVLLLFFSIFIYVSVNDVLRQRRDPLFAETRDNPATPARSSALVSIPFLVGGLAGLTYGGQLTVDGAVAVARSLGLSQDVIGLTVVAIGTSLPELVTSVIATSRRQTDIAIGNVIGSNVFNLLFILGTSSSFITVPVPEGGLQDLVILLGVTVLLMPIAITNRRRIVRLEGLFLLAIWIGYTSWRVVGVTG